MGETRKREVSAGLVVFCAGRVLVIRNRFDEWVLPKGKVEPGEGLEDAALREVREETNIRAEIVGPAGETEYVYRSEVTGETVAKVVHWFAGTIEGEVKGSPPRTRPQVEEGISVAAFIPWQEAAALLKYDGKLVREVASSLTHAVGTPGWGEGRGRK